MNLQTLLNEIRRHLPLRVYAKGPVLEMFRELGERVDKNTPLKAVDVFRSQESGEILCTLAGEGGNRATASLGYLRVDIGHPLFNGIREYRREMERGEPARNLNSPAFRVGDLYKRK